MIPTIAAALILNAAHIGLPAWTQQVRVLPATATPLKVKGAKAPADLVLVKGNGGVSLIVAGPGKLRIRIHLLTLKHGPEKNAPIILGLDDQPTSELMIPGEPNRRWKLVGQSLFGLGGGHALSLQIPAGEHLIEIRPKEPKALGLAVSARFTPGAAPASAPPPTTAAATPPRPSAAAPPPPGAPRTAPPPAPGGGSTPPIATAVPPSPAPPVAAPAGEPEIPVPTSGPGQPGPQKVAALASAPAGFTFRHEPDPMEIETPTGAEDFRRITVDDGLDIDVTGPGTLIIEMHALRDPSLPETLNPVIAALLVDEVLEQTIALAQPASEKYWIVGASYTPSARVRLELPVSTGTHHTQISLSDNAVRGIVVRARFNAGSSTHVEPRLSVERPPIVETAGAGDTGPASEFTAAVHGGMWMPPALASPGMVVTIDATMRLPVSVAHLAAGLMIGFEWASRSQFYADPRVEAGRGTVSTSVLQVPIGAILRWQVQLGESFALRAGLGGGVLLALPRADAGAVAGNSSIVPAPQLTVHIDGVIPAGPGALVVRLAAQLATTLGAASVTNINPSGGFVSIGYQYSRSIN